MDASCRAQEVREVVIQPAGRQLDPRAEQRRRREQSEIDFVGRLFNLSAERRAELAKLSEPKPNVAPANPEMEVQRLEKANRLRAALGQVVRVQNLDTEYLPQLRERILASLTPEQQATYKAETLAREMFTLRVNAESLAVFLSDQLDLSAEQRTALTGEFMQWSEIKDFSAASLFQNQYQIPALPEGLVVKHLNPDQAVMYNAMQRSRGGQRQVLRLVRPVGE
jgi:hypothetical protein